MSVAGAVDPTPGLSTTDQIGGAERRVRDNEARVARQAALAVFLAQNGRITAAKIAAGLLEVFEHSLQLSRERLAIEIKLSDMARTQRDRQKEPPRSIGPFSMEAVCRGCDTCGGN